VTRLRTSARLTTDIWAFSTEIARYGRVISVGRFPPPTLLARGILAQYVESLMLHVRPLLGEELVLVAQR